MEIRREVDLVGAGQIQEQIERTLEALEIDDERCVGRSLGHDYQPVSTRTRYFTVIYIGTSTSPSGLNA